MKSTEQHFLGSEERGIEVSAENRTCDIAAQFSRRGLVRSVEKDTEAQLRREEQLRSEEPTYYRLSTLSEDYVEERYRHGKEVMDGEDLLEYFGETRAMRAETEDFAKTLPADELVKSGEAEKPCVVSVRGETRQRMRERISALPQAVRRLPEQTVERVKISTPLWFNGAKADSSREARRFPLSAFAAILAIAMSLMLVVASSVLVNHAENRLNTLKIEVSHVASEVSDIQAELSVGTDVIALREVAVNELGMVDEDFVRMEYVSNDTEDSIVILEEEESESIGLSAILNALGIK